MRDNPHGGKLDAADDVCRRCKNNFPSVLSCIGKRTREGCGRGREVEIIHNGRDVEGPVLLRKPKESERTESCDKDFVSNNIRIAICLIFAMTGASGMGKGECCSCFGERACLFITGKSSTTWDPLEA